MTKSGRFSMYLSKQLTEELSQRSGEDHGEGLSGTARRDLERYYDALRRELRTVSLSQSEAMLLLDVCNGTIWQPFSIPLLWSEVEDGLPDGLGEKWGVDGPAFVGTLRAMTAGQAFAVVDALERAWKIGGDLGAAARTVGLIRGAADAER